MKRKKLFLTIVLILLPILLLGCNISLNGKRPNNFYYTNLLAKNLTLETSYKCIAINTNFYREKSLSKEDADTIKNFTKSLNKNSFIEKPKDLPQKTQYKLILTFSKEKYVINIYNERYISVFPWDGSYSMDYIDMSNIEVSYNLFGLSKYVVAQ